MDEPPSYPNLVYQRAPKHAVRRTLEPSARYQPWSGPPAGHAAFHGGIFSLVPNARKNAVMAGKNARSTEAGRSLRADFEYRRLLSQLAPETFRCVQNGSLRHPKLFDQHFLGNEIDRTCSRAIIEVGTAVQGS